MSTAWIIFHYPFAHSKLISNHTLESLVHDAFKSSNTLQLIYLYLSSKKNKQAKHLSHCQTKKKQIHSRTRRIAPVRFTMRFSSYAARLFEETYIFHQFFIFPHCILVSNKYHGRTAVTSIQMYYSQSQHTSMFLVITPTDKLNLTGLTSTSHEHFKINQTESNRNYRRWNPTVYLELSNCAKRGSQSPTQQYHM